MRIQDIHLKDFYPLKGDPILQIIGMNLNEEWTPVIGHTPIALIVPGGGYSMVSKREGDPVASAFLARGYLSAVLYYSVPSTYPEVFQEALAAVSYLRRHAGEWKANKDALVAVGFSAGGHLAASLGYLGAIPDVAGPIGVPYEEGKPNALVLGYPVITARPEYAETGTVHQITQEDPKLKELLSVEHHVGSDYPPTFIWNTKDDPVVPALNGDLLYEACQKAGVPVKYVQYPTGPHGLSLAYRYLEGDGTEKYPKAEQWTGQAFAFLEKNLPPFQGK